MQVFGHVARRRVTVGRSLGEGLQANALQLPGDRVVDLAGRARVGASDLIDDVGDRVALEGPASGQELVEHDAQAEDIRAAVDSMALATGLLGAHVNRRAGHPGALAEVFVSQREAEIRDARLSSSRRAGCWPA